MNNTTDTNRASEDELRAELAQYLESTYQDGAVMATRPNSGYHKRVDEFTDKLLAIIRTEKLKLLAEVREEAFSGGLSFELDDDGGQIVIEVETDLQSIITKLEAEL